MFKKLIQKLKHNPKTIVFTEGTDARILEAAAELLKDSLQVLSRLLEKHYGKKVIMLIDEYDVPLDKAYQSGYYDDMVELVRILFGNALKTNESLDFAGRCWRLMALPGNMMR